MTECIHVFVGSADGVCCGKCGLHLSADEYAQMLATESNNSKPTSKRTKSKKEENANG